MKTFASLSAAFFCTQVLTAQVVKGSVRDYATQSSLIGATVKIQDTEPLLGATTDLEGNFLIQNCPLGRRFAEVSYFGYKTELVEILASTGKEAVIDISLEEDLQSLQVVEVLGQKKTSTVNKLAKVSAKALSMQTVTRFSGGRSDLARVTSSFAGVAMQGDERNEIVVRGNSPNGVLWRLEGIPVSNPNHFSLPAFTSGSQCALNPNMLAQSDFFTGAYPAEYGNSLSGVMDMRLAVGNKDKHEFKGQIGIWSGAELFAEGPMLKKQNGSYAIAYRYSFPDLLDKAGVKLEHVPKPQYQDLCYNFDFHGKKQHINIYGLLATSAVTYKNSPAEHNIEDRPVNEYVRYDSRLGDGGIRYQYLFDSVSYLKTIVSVGRRDVAVDRGIVEVGEEEAALSEEKNLEGTFRFSSQYNRKLSRRTTLRAGFTSQHTDLDDLSKARIVDSAWVALRDFDRKTWLHEAYAQMQYKIKKKFSINVGLHAQYSPFLDKAILEPRLVFKQKLPNSNDLIVAYGLHSQLPFFQTLFYNDRPGNFPNAALDFIRSNQFVLGWDKKLAAGWRLHTEAYLQWITRVPVDTFASPYSALNDGSFNQPYPANAKTGDGTGKNYGLEVTLSRSFKNGFYATLNASVFDSKYRGSDKTWRNTAFNSRFICNGLLGKEFPLPNRNLTFTFDTKISAMGGRYYTPIDLQKSLATDSEVLDERFYFREQLPASFQWDVRAGLRKNGRKVTQTFYLDLSNITNRKNIAFYFYQPRQTQIFTKYNNLGILPDLMYRIEF